MKLRILGATLLVCFFGALTGCSGDDKPDEAVATDDQNTAEAAGQETVADDSTGQQDGAPAEEQKPGATIATQDSTKVVDTKNVDVGGSFNYAVQRGDTFSKLAIRIYGDKSKWTMISQMNPSITNPHKIEVGQVLKISVTDAASKAFANMYLNRGAKTTVAGKIGTGATETVRPGDTLGTIAKRALGSSSQWRAIWMLNQQNIPNPNVLEVGQQIAIPQRGI